MTSGLPIDKKTKKTLIQAQGLMMADGGKRVNQIETIGIALQYYIDNH